MLKNLHIKQQQQCQKEFIFLLIYKFVRQTKFLDSLIDFNKAANGSQQSRKK